MKRAATVVLIVFVAFFALIISTFYGMNGKIKTETNKKAVTELTFINSWGGNDAKASCLEDLLDEFNKEHPDIKVTNKSISGDDFLPYLKERFRTGEQPEVFGLWPGSDIRSLIAAGKVADLTQIIDSDPGWKNNFDEKDWSLVEKDGKVYGVPVEMTYEGLFINKRLFKSCEAQVPRTYDELKEDIEIFKKHNIIPIAYNATPEGSYLYQNILTSLGGKEIENPFDNNKINKSYIDAMYIMRDLYNMGAFPEKHQCFSMDSATRDNLFLDEKAAMIVQGSWFSAKCKNKDVQLVKFPQMSETSGNTMVYGLGCGTFHISEQAMKNPQKKDAAIKLLKFLSSTYASAQLAKQTDMISCVDIKNYNIQYDELTERGAELINDTSVLIGPPDSYINRSVWEGTIVKEFPSMLESKISPEELWDKAVADGAREDKS